jgi:hypothetical protein
MDPHSISKFVIKENRKTRSNGLPIIDHSLSPEGLCAFVVDAAKTREWKAGSGSMGRMDQGG